MFYDLDVGTLVRMTRRHFAEINRDKTLTDEDKKRLKEFYLQQFIAPRARKLLQKHFPEDFLTEATGTARESARHTASSHRTA